MPIVLFEDDDTVTREWLKTWGLWKVRFIYEAKETYSGSMTYKRALKIAQSLQRHCYTSGYDPHHPRPLSVVMLPEKPRHNTDYAIIMLVPMLQNFENN